MKGISFITFLYVFLFTNFSVGSIPLSNIFLILIVIYFIKIDGWILESKFQQYFLFFVFCFSILSLFLVLYNQSFYFNEVVRIVRVAFYFYITNLVFKNNKNELYVFSIFLITIHGVFVILSSLNKNIFDIISSVTQYDKGWFFLRGNGFAGSFDTAGFLLICGIVLLSIKLSLKNTILALFLVFAGFFTGRTFMFLGPFVFIVFHLISRNSIKKSIYILLLIIIVFLTIVICDVGLDMFYDLISKLGKGDGYHNSTNTLLNWASNFSHYMYFLGDGEYLLGVDIGYFKALSYGGVIYLIFQTLLIVYFAFNNVNKKGFIWIVTFLFVFFIYNFKIYAFFAGIYMPLFFVVCYFLKDKYKVF